MHVGRPGGLVAELDELLDGLAARVLLQQPQPLGDLADDLVVAERLAQRLDAPLLGEEEVHLPAEEVAADVVLFQLGVDRQDDVGEEAVVLQPGMLGEA